MGIGDKTSQYIKKRLRQKGLLKNTSQTTVKQSPPTLQELNQSNNKGDGIIKSPYRTNKQLTGDPKHKSEYQWLHDPVKGVEWDYNPVRIRELAQSDAWVQMLVNTMTTEIANTPWQIVEEDGTGETAKSFDPFERVSKQETGTPATSEAARKAREFTKHPNPDEDFTDLLEQITADMLEVGSLAIPLMFSESDYQGDELVSENPTLIHAKPSDPITFTKEYREKTGMLSGFWQYERQNNSATQIRGRSTYRPDPIRFDQEELVWTDLNPRSNRRYGLPPTKAVENILQLMDLTIEQEQDFFSRGSHLAGFLKTNGDITESNALQDEVQGEQGRVGGFFKVDDPDAEWVQMGSNWKEMDMTEREKWYAQVIASEFQVPTSVVGLETEELNRSTFQSERGNFESNTLGPYLQKIERMWNQQVIKPFFGRELRFEFKPGMSEDQRQQISDRKQKEFQNGLITRNEYRTEVGYEPVDEDGFRDEVMEESNAAAEEDAGEALQQLSLSEAVKTSKDAEIPDAVILHFGMGGEAVDHEHESDSWEAFLDDLDKEGTVFEVRGDEIIEYPDEMIEPHDAMFYVIGTDKETVEEIREDHPAVYDALKVTKEKVGKPFGPFDDFEDCKTSMMGDGYDEDSAEQICGSLQAELKECKQCGDSIEKSDNKKFCNKECYNDFLSKDGDSKKKVEAEKKDEPLRETSEFFEFDVQPGDVEGFADELRTPINDVLTEILSNPEIQDLIERFAAEQEDEDLEKNSSEISRRLREILTDAGLADRIVDVVQDNSAEMAVEAVMDAASDTGMSVEEDEVLEAARDRDVDFAGDFTQRLQDQMQEIVSNGWQEGKSVTEIQNDLQEKADDLTDNQAETIARTELQRASSHAREGFAEQNSMALVWQATGDDRTRQAHADMDGKWKMAYEDWIVEYPEAGEVTEPTQADSKHGINCRCYTELVPQDEIDSLDESLHAGDQL